MNRTASRTIRTLTAAALITGGAAGFAVPASAAPTPATGHSAVAPMSTGAEKGAAAAEALRSKYEGVAVDVDGAYGAQCWDLAARYSLDNGLPAIATGDGAAAGIFENFDSNGNAAHYDKHVNSTTDPSSVPRAGDVLVWNRNMGGGYGHVAVVLKADWNTVTVLEQNPGAPHVTTYKNYANVSGWLRPKAFA